MKGGEEGRGGEREKKKIDILCGCKKKKKGNIIL